VVGRRNVGELTEAPGMDIDQAMAEQGIPFFSMRAEDE
jgi:hypothetical protein